jgi:hypothetical protein
MRPSAIHTPVIFCSRHARLLLLTAAVAFTVPALAYAQAAAANGTQSLPTLRAVRTTAPIVLDGKLDEEAWAAAPAATRFRQSEPTEGQDASERTEIRVLYDERTIYIGARMFDSQSSAIVRRLSRRDDYHVDADWLTVYLDPHHDHLTGAKFQVTAAGSLGDAVLYNDTHEDESWDGVWDAKVSVDDRGWTAEMAIPLSQLRFVSGDQQTWGLNVERFIRRKNESDWWELVLKKESGTASRMGHLEGLDGIQPRRHLDLLPYATARAEYVGAEQGNPFNDGSRYFGTAGLDAKWGITSNLTLDATVNPDFGQVEVDPAVVNLTAYETFYEEKRPFFTEGSSIFGNFGRSGLNSYDGINRVDPTLFYSRRIGREPHLGAGGDFVDAPNATTILGAAKLTGKTATGWSVGLLEAVTGREFARVDTAGARSDVEVEPLTNYLVGRAHRTVGKRASVGVLLTGVERDLRTTALADTIDNRAYAVGGDGHLLFGPKNDWVVSGLFAGSIVQGSPIAISRLQRNSTHYYQRPDATHVAFDPAATSLSGWDGQLNLNKNSGDLQVNASLWGVSPGFEVNDAGYFQTADRAGLHGVVVWKKPTLDRFTRSRGLVVGKANSWNFGREMQGDIYLANAEATLRNYWDVRTMAIMFRESFDDRLTRGGPTATSPGGYSVEASIESDSRKRVAVELGGNYDTSSAGGFASRVELSFDIKPLSSLTISFGPEVSRSHAIAQYVRSVNDPTATATYGGRYVFGDLDQTEVSGTTRVNWMFSPRASLQVYMQPLVSTGRYWNFKQLAAPRTFEFQRYGVDVGTITHDAAERAYLVDPDGAGPARPFGFANPDFNYKSLRVNAVFRWEWRLGSTLYVVWTQNREDEANPSDGFALRRSISSLFGARGDNVFAIKVAYWLTR